MVQNFPFALDAMETVPAQEIEFRVRNFHQKLEPGMVIALEPLFVFAGKGIVGLEDDYFVTETRVERLTLTDQTFIKI